MKKGEKICIEYQILLANEVVEEATTEDPMCFTLGDGQMAYQLEQHLFALEVGQEHTLHLAPEQHFGYSQSELIQWMDRSEFAVDMPLQVGLVIGFSLPNGEEIPGIVRQLREHEVEVDFNPLLAGKDLIFRVKILPQLQ